MIDVKSVPGLLWQVPHSSPLEVSCTTCPTPYWTAKRKPCSPPWHEEQSAGTEPCASKRRNVTSAPLKWPTSVRVALLMSTLTVSTVSRSVIAS